MKKLDNLRWTPRWVSHLGCVKGCLDYLGIEITDGWLYGGTGHAFVINIHPEICPSGPTAWCTTMLFELAQNLGYRASGVFGHKDENLSKTQAEAWDFTRQAIDEGLPVYGWELDIPEFYVVYGYDEIGYYFSGAGANDGSGPKPWHTLGDTGTGIIEMYRVEPVPSQDPTIVVKAALQAGLRHAANPIHNGYASGLQAYDLWIKGLEAGKAGRFGMGYNTAVWAECRHFAVDFLEEASQRLGAEATPLFDEALNAYRQVAESLDQVSKIYPFEHMDVTVGIQPDSDCQAAVDLLHAAQVAEADGLKALEKITAFL